LLGVPYRDQPGSRGERGSDIRKKNKSKWGMLNRRGGKIKGGKEVRGTRL